MCIYLQVATGTRSLLKSNNAVLVEYIRNFTVSSRLFGNWPQIQKPAPEFCGTAVIKGDFKEIKLSDYKGKYVVLFFYPLDLYVILLNYHIKHPFDVSIMSYLFIFCLQYICLPNRDHSI